MITDLTTTSTVFDVENISVGDLIVLWDEQDYLIGTGVIIEITQLDITCALHTGSETFEDIVTKYRVDLEEVLNGQLRPVVICPIDLKP